MMYQQDPEDNDMGAYGVSYGSKDTSGGYPSKYDQDSPSQNKNDPYNWDNSKPASSKFENNSKTKKVNDEFEDTGYDGWNDVKKASKEVNRYPDPYAKKSSGKDFDSYFDDNKKPSQPKSFDFESQNSRGKATTVVKKNDDDFFNSGFNQGSGTKTKSNQFDDSKQPKAFDFEKSNQPKSFDFDDFGKNIDKKKDNNDFDNMFSDSKPAKKATQSNDPFAWEQEAKNATKARPKQEDFDFDFDSGKSKESSAAKKNVADFLDDHSATNSKNDFDPFANHTSSSTSAPHDLSGIKFDVPAPTKQFNDPFENENEPVVQSETPEPKVEPQRDVSDPWAKKELFNLNNLQKTTKKVIEIKSNELPGKNNLGGFGSSNDFGQNLLSTSFGGSLGPTPQTKEGRMNAIDDAFGPSSTSSGFPQTSNTMQGFGTAKPQTKNNDFGEFPSMFGGSNDGFGNFSGFGGDGFSNTFNDNFEGHTHSKPAAQPTKQTQPSGKKDDWFEF